jgi:hypothetical protein
VARKGKCLGCCGAVMLMDCSENADQVMLVAEGRMLGWRKITNLRLGTISSSLQLIGTLGVK